jgi:hypothetical protein
VTLTFLYLPGKLQSRIPILPSWRALVSSKGINIFMGVTAFYSPGVTIVIFVFQTRDHGGGLICYQHIFYSDQLLMTMVGDESHSSLSLCTVQKQLLHHS